jgi:hypothetical protein
LKCAPALLAKTLRGAVQRLIVRADGWHVSMFSDAYSAVAEHRGVLHHRRWRVGAGAGVAAVALCGGIVRHC